MRNFMRYFPLSAAVEPGNARQFLVALAIYLVACAVLGVLTAILGWIPLVGWLLDLVFSLLGIYCVVGLALSIYQFVRR